MSKEEILRQEYEKVFSAQKYDNSVNKGMNQQYIFPAMDEYAKQQSIEFAEWVNGNYYRYNRPGKVYMDVDYKIYQPDELFEKFLQSKQPTP